jgi:hypothetical protein
MRPEQLPSPEASSAESTSAPETPDVQALLKYYRSAAHGQRRRRQVLTLGGALIAACAVIGAVLSIGSHTPRKDASPTREVHTLSVAPANEADELRPQPQPSGQPLGPEARASGARRLDAPANPPAPSAARSRPTPAPLRHQPRERLAAVRPGEAKEHVFDLFAGTVERRNGTLVRIEGMRLRATGRSPDHTRVEIAEVEISDTGTGTLYWFLFGDSRLLAWGRPDEWPAAKARYQLEIAYR